MATFSANRLNQGEVERVINSVITEADEFSDSFVEPLFSSNLAYASILSASDSYLSVRLASGATFSIWGSNLLADDLSPLATRIEISSSDSYLRMNGRLYLNYPESTGTVDSVEATRGNDTYSAAGDFYFDSNGELVGKNTVETYVIGSVSVVMRANSAGRVSSIEVGTADGLVLEISGDWDREDIDNFDALFAGNDRFIGTSGEDYFFSTQRGNDVYLGSSGTDTLRLIGPKSNYSISDSASGEKILTNNATQQKFTLDSIERVQFDDQLFSFDDQVTSVMPVQVAPVGGASAYLAQFGLTVAFARQFIIDNLGTPQYIYATALLFGITNSYFSEILNVPKAAVVGYWGALGLDATALDGAEIVGTTANGNTSASLIF